ncbi:MAG: hypothetical protein JSW04_00425 [Desulfobacterales bacterium]|nr:MAG: hypothetical protein JSW04_00425 [Desulfobacterales bacterium]
MNKINIYKTFMAFVVSALLITPPAVAIAKTQTTTLKGTIEGALCVLQGKKCPPHDLDAHLLIENNFVLLASDGKHYYLPNLNRSLKVRYVGKDVQVTGSVNGESIIVDRFEMKEGGKYKVVWSKEKQKKEFINYFETLPAG